MFSVGLILSVGLVACGKTSKSASNATSTSSIAKTTMSKTIARSEYIKTSNALASVLQETADNKLQITQSVRNIASSNGKKVSTYQNKLVSYKSSDNLRLIKAYNSAVIQLLSDFDQEQIPSTYPDDMKNVTSNSKKIVNRLKISLPTQLQNASNSWDKVATTLPGVSGKTIRTTNFSITFNSVKKTADDDAGKTDAVVYYTFKNTSKNKTIRPSYAIADCGEMTQENSTSIVDLDMGIPDSESNDQSALEDVGMQHVKPGATVKSVTFYQLDNVDNPLKFKATDPGNDDTKLGTVTLNIN